MSAITCEITGVSTLEQSILAIMANTPGALKTALREEAELVMGEAKRLCPTGVSGALRDSGVVMPVQMTGAEISETMGFGGPSAPYAAAVHEGSRPHFPPSQALELWVRRVLGVSPKDAPGVAFVIARAISKRGTPSPGHDHRKFLERPFLEHAGRLSATLARSCADLVASKTARAARRSASEFVGAGGGGSL